MSLALAVPRPHQGKVRSDVPHQREPIVVDGASTRPARLLTLDDVADYLGIGRRTLDKLRSAGEFPAPDLRLKRRILRWRLATVDAWIAANAGRQGLRNGPTRVAYRPSDRRGRRSAA